MQQLEAKEFQADKRAARVEAESIEKLQKIQAQVEMAHSEQEQLVKVCQVILISEDQRNNKGSDKQKIRLSSKLKILQQKQYKSNSRKINKE